MSLRTKLILLALLPLILISLIIGWVSIHQIKQLGEKELYSFEKNLLDTREQALRDHLSLAMNGINHLVDSPALTEQQAKEQVKNILTELRYGEDGYFFVYDSQGINLVHPIQSELIGQNLYDLQDERGNYLIKSLIAAAQDGGGFVKYEWRKPSSGDVVTKLSYAEWLPEWQWMVGTGLYIEDIQQQLSILSATVDNNIRTTFFTVFTLVIITIIVIIACTLGINLHEHRLADDQLKRLAHKTVMFQENEKKHLARELHDGINQLLISSKCHFELYRKQNHNACDVDTFERGHQSLLRAITELRDISHSLRPSTLDDIGLTSALKGLIADFESHSRQTVNYQLTSAPLPLHSETITTLYRVAQESLTNIHKHAKATKVEVMVDRLGDVLQLVIRDNGCGFSIEQVLAGEGIGLRNMRERIEFIGGQFELTAEPDYGTEITVVIDLSKDI